MNYGYQEMITLMNLQDAGLFKLKDKKVAGYVDWNWEKIKDQFKLINEEANLISPSDISYVFNGFCPMSVRIIERIIEQQGMTSMQQKGQLKLIGLTEDKYTIPKTEANLFAAPTAPNGVTIQPRASFKKKKILVYFLGGITYGEIAALRFLQNIHPKFKIVIATTTIITGQRAIESLVGTQDNGLLLSELIKWPKHNYAYN